MESVSGFLWQDVEIANDLPIPKPNAVRHATVCDQRSSEMALAYALLPSISIETAVKACFVMSYRPPSHAFAYLFECQKF
jgi:hypothetical protein